jgi:uncharacterized protein (TIGR02217 family)
MQEMPMSFVETRFPDDIAYGSTGGPGYSTDVVMTVSGHEQRNVNWEHARARYNVAHGVKSQTQLDALIAFFRARKGRAYGFRFKDWSDYKAVNQLLGEGDGSTVQFQLVKYYDGGVTSETRIIHKPVQDMVNIYVNSVLQESGVAVDYAAGTVAFTSAPPNGATISADFEFDVPVRFDTDSLSARLENYGAYSWNDIPLVELRMS